MEIELVGENYPREVEFIGKVKCLESKEHDMSWEFQEGEEYNLYEQEFDDGEIRYIVLNDNSGWYAFYIDKDNLCGDTFMFITK